MTQDKAKQIEYLSNNLFNQSHLVEQCLEKEMFDYGDIQNVISEDEDETIEVFTWYAFTEDSEFTIAKLNEAKVPYLKNEYGLWIGRQDFGSSWELYFLPALAEALYTA